MAREANTFDNVKFSTYLWSRAYAALQMVTLREKGAEGITSLKYNFMNGHGVKHFLGGVDKLGIRNDPPAIVGAKYHYMSNCLIGDVAMEYVQESEKKAWIRYLAPSWAYPGSGLMAVPASVQMASFQAWHRNNGTWLGCRRLAYVCTKLYQYGEPYDEGYFVEHDHDIPIEQAFRVEAVTSAPHFDPVAAPKLDPVQWPQERLLKARRRYAESYTAVPAQVLLDMYGVPLGSYLIKQAMLGLGTQYAHEIADKMGVAGRDAASLSTLFFKMLSTLGEDVEVEKMGSAYALTRSSFAPIDESALEEVHDAYFGLVIGMLKVLSQFVKLERSVESKGGRRLEVWRFGDSSTRLF